MKCDHLAAKESEKDRQIYEILNLLELDSCIIEEVTVLWQAAEEKLSEFQKLFFHKISIIDFRDYVENVLQGFHNHAIPPTIKKVKSIPILLLLVQRRRRETFQ